MLNLQKNRQLTSPKDVPQAKTLFRQGLFKISKTKLFKEKQHFYSAPSGFTPWKDILGHLLYFEGSLSSTLQSGLSELKCEAEAGLASSYALYKDSPVRNISRNLGEAFLKTSTNGIIKPPIALEHFIINLPDNLLFDEWKYPLKALLVMTGTAFRLACARYGINLTLDKNSTNIDGWEGLYITGFCDYGTALVDTTRWDDLNHSESDLNPYCIAGYKSETHAACTKMRQIAVHTLLTMAYRPELISESKSFSTSSGYKFSTLKKDKQARNNVWIGEGFISKTRKRLKSDDNEGSPIASHWRRGHWHTYLVGAKKTKQSLKWIEPIHVNSNIL
tara:strand:- start:280 stop:1278 length:999 start_codon:yes stop_codon:yes gene_type:complete